MAILFLVVSCKTTKFVPENKLLLTKNIIEINGKKNAETNLNPYIIQKPNSKAAGLPLSLWFYNMGNENYQEKWDRKILKYADSSHLATKVFSLKQSIGWANFNKDFNEWLFKNGEAPILLDTLKANKTQKTLSQYYLDQGFFNSRINYKIDTLSEKKAQVVYQIDKGSAYKIDSIFTNIASPVIDSLYKRHKSKSLIKENRVFKRENFENEAERLTQIFRNSGVYHFSKYSITFKDIDSTRADHRTNVLIDIADRLIELEDTLLAVPYEISKIKEVNVYTDYSYSRKNIPITNTLTYNDIQFLSYDDLDFKPEILYRYIFLKPGNIYSDKNNLLTRNYLNGLSIFKSLRIEYEEIADHELRANIYLTPSKRYGLKLEAEFIHSNQKPFGVSGKATLNNKNTFHRNEVFEIGLQGSFLNSAEISDGKFINAWEIGVDASYKIPRFFLPFSKNFEFLKSKSPTTIFTLGTSLQKNVGLDKQRFTFISAYDWSERKKYQHTFELLNAQFINNLNVNSFFNIYRSEYSKLENIRDEYFPDYLDLSENSATSFIQESLNDTDFALAEPEAYQEVKNIEKRYDIITENSFIPAISYQFTFNDQVNFNDYDFSFFRAQITSSGVLASQLATEKNENNTKQILNTNIAQFIKLDFDYRRHWLLKYDNVLAFRVNIGYALPYGNSSSLPFSRSYFAGGPNDIRAWRIYDLGPGSEESISEFNTGNFKFLSNLEYRFNIIRGFKGALFIDAGNIWDTTNSDLTSEQAKFKNFDSIKEIGIGSGFGIRYDFSFLVLRGDLGFKTYEPYLKNNNKWFKNYNFKNSVFNIGINYPF